MIRLPDPPVQVRRYLTVCLRQGVPFDQAWKFAEGRTIYPHDRNHREQYKAVLAETRWAFELAYNGLEIPGGAFLLAIAQSLPNEGNGASSSTSAFQDRVPREEREAA
jgi:hypothetical protein